MRRSRRYELKGPAQLLVPLKPGKGERLARFLKTGKRNRRLARNRRYKGAYNYGVQA